MISDARRRIFDWTLRLPVAGDRHKIGSEFLTLFEKRKIVIEPESFQQNKLLRFWAYNFVYPMKNRKSCGYSMKSTQLYFWYKPVTWEKRALILDATEMLMKDPICQNFQILRSRKATRANPRLTFAGKVANYGSCSLELRFKKRS